MNVISSYFLFIFIITITTITNAHDQPIGRAIDEVLANVTVPLIKADTAPEPGIETALEEEGVEGDLVIDANIPERVPLANHRPPANVAIEQLQKPHFQAPPRRDRPLCGAMIHRVERLINAVPVRRLQHSWIVPLIVLFNPDSEVVNTRLCSGTLIHESYIITAASCLKGIENKRSTIRIGFKMLNISRLYNGENMEEMIIFVGRNLFIHPEFKSLRDDDGIAITTVNDLALIRLERPTHLMPICVPYNVRDEYEYPRVESIMSLYSWGKTNKAKDYPDVLMGTRLRVTPNEECFKSYTHRNYDSRAIFCGKNYKTPTCGFVGDVGTGGYVYDENNVAVLGGVLTMSKYDDSCETPNTFQRISAHVGWIRSVLNSPPVQ